MESNKGINDDINKRQQPEGEKVNEENRSIPVIEEKLKIEKKTVETGRVLISKNVKENVEEVEIPLMHEEVTVDRVEKNQYVDDAPPAVRYEGETMIIPVLKEVIEKRIILVEELHVTKKKDIKQEKQKIKLKEENINIERVNTGTGSAARKR